MARETIVVCKVLLAALFVGALAAQTVILPWMAAEVVAVFPEVQNLKRPILVLSVLAVACVEAALVCCWRLLTLVGQDRVSGRSSLSWLSALVLWLLATAVLLGTILSVITEADQGTGGPIPPLALLVGTAGSAVAALLVLVMRHRMKQAAQREGHGVEAAEGGRWGDEVWLGFAIGFLCLTPFSTFIAFSSGFDFDPNDYPGSYYLEQIPERQGIMAITMLIPAVSAMAAAVAAVVQPRLRRKTAAAVVIFVLAALDFWLCWVLGSDAVESARRFAEIF